MDQLRASLGKPVSGQSLAAFRIGFGAVQLYQTWEFIRPIGDISTLEYLYTGPDRYWNFPYPGFEWIRPLPEPLTTILFALLAASSLLLMLGWFTRTAAILNSATFTYAWMMEQTWWNNHYYLSSLFALMLALTPSARCFSIDRWRQSNRLGLGNQTDGLIPAWCVYWFRAQLYVVYTYAAVVKMNADWFMGEPIRLWFREEHVGQPLSWILTNEQLERIYSTLGSEFSVYTVVWFGLVFDLTIGLLLLVRRTQVLGLVLMVLFHASNFWLFMIGAFPVMAISSTFIFLDPDWPIRLGRWMKHPKFTPPDPGWMLLGMFLVPIVGAVLGWKIPRSDRQVPSSPAIPVRSWTVALLTGWMLVQSLLPLRHLTIEGDVHWTLEGSRFSWQVMARHHVGQILYRIKDPTWPSAQAVAEGTPIRWPALDDAENRHLFREIDSFAPDLTSQPEIFVLSEPWLRERILINPARAGGDNPTQFAEKEWKRLYGRAPTAIAPCRPLPALMEEFQGEIIKAFGRNLPPIGLEMAAACRAIVEIHQHLAELPPDHPASRERTIDLQIIMGKLIERAGQTPLNVSLTSRLLQVRPFDIQSGRGIDCYQVIDLDLRRDPKSNESIDNTSAFDWESWRGTNELAVDLLRTNSTLRQLFPKVFLGFDDAGEPTAFWNAYRDLRPLQYDGHIPSGIMIHQYVDGRIVPFWEALTGHRPHVYVDAFSKLNQHPLQRLIDPNIDLASVPVSVWTHNPWIMDQQYRRVVEHDRGIPRLRLDPAYPAPAMVRD